MKVVTLGCKATFISQVLGSANANKDLYGEFLGSRSGDADKMQEELGALPVEELKAKGTTVFHRSPAGECMLLDYQIKGMLKANCEQLVRIADSESKKLKAWRKALNLVHVYPRQIVMSPPKLYITTEGGGPDEQQRCVIKPEPMEHKVRPLRIDDWKTGERSALAASEMLPIGTWFEFQVETHPALLKPTLEWLERGKKNGLGQWRNGGYGLIDVEVLSAKETEVTVDALHKQVQALLKDK